MSLYEQVLQQIDKSCHINNATAFELEVFSPISWKKTYRKQKSLFSYSWQCVDSEENTLSKFEQTLSQLPKGISYKTHTTITNPLPDISAPSHTAHETYLSTYKVIVSDSYSKKIALSHSTAKVILSSVFDSNTIEAAERFKNHVISSQKSIVKTLAQDDTFYRLTNTELGNSHDTITFKRLNLKPLSNEAQRLGLAMAIASYNAAFIKDSQFYFIARSNKDSIDICKSTRISCKSSLKEW